MKPFASCVRHLCAGLFLISTLLWLAPPARATQFFHMEFFQDNNPNGVFYYAFPYLDSDPQPATSNFIYSAGGQLRYVIGTNNTFLDAAGGSFPTLTTLIHEITNGLWTIVINSNHVSQATYKFKINITNLNATTYPLVTISSPLHNETGVSPHPAYAWSGPTNYEEFFPSVRRPDFSLYYSELLNATNTTWPDAPSLPSGAMQFEANFGTTNTASMIQTTTPTNALGALAGWSSVPKLRTYRVHDFEVISPPADSGHTLVAHYAFDTTNFLGEVQGTDTSGNGNDINSSVSWALPPREFSTDTAAGDGAVRFYGGDAFAPPIPVVQSLAGSFTVSAWMKTSQVYGNDEDDGNNGAAVISARMGYPKQDTVPLAITGNKAAFYTANTGGNSDTLHSTSDVNNGTNYVHVVVTRSQFTGVKKIYINGVLEDTSTGTTAPLDGPQDVIDLLIGGNIFNGLDGLLDDVQFYTGVLSAGEVAALYAVPGSTAPNVSANGIVAHFPFDDVDAAGDDLSVNNYDMNFGGSFGGASSFLDSIAIAGTPVGTNSVRFYRDTGAAYMGWDPETPPGLLGTLAGDFSVSLWIRTTDGTGFEDDFAFEGAGIVSADVDGGAGFDVVPVALTGGQVAFNTGGDFGDETLNSETLVNDDMWHHIVVTRQRSTGEKKIYIDGVLDATGSGATNLLNEPQLLTIGALSDAGSSDPNDANYHNGYDGLLDDLQIYGRVLTGGEVTFLKNNPGLEVGDVPELGPISISMNFYVYRYLEAGGYESVFAFPLFNVVDPPSLSTNIIESPNGVFQGTQDYNQQGGGGSTTLSSLAALINECTNGVWKLYINKGHPTEKLYTFTASVSNLFNSNFFGLVNIGSPANGATNISTNAPFTWTGPAFPDISLFLSRMPNFNFLASTNLTTPATSWPSPPALVPGTTNELYVGYSTNNAPVITFSMPLDAESQPLADWSTGAILTSAAKSQFQVVASSVPIAVQLVSVQHTGGTFRFSFTTQNGHPHVIQANTNLVNTNGWVTLSNVAGDGTLKQFTFPATNSRARYFRVRTQ